MPDDDFREYANQDFSEFARSELGPEADTLTHVQKMERLQEKAKREKWISKRGLYFDTCHLCGWKGQHTTVGPWWHIVKDGPHAGTFYEDLKRRHGMRRNFLYSEKHGAWVCLRCVRQNYAHHPDSGKEKPS